jgi:hypothetical protein
MIDVEAAVVAWLNSSTPIQQLVSDRVYSPRLPKNLTGDQEIPKSIVLGVRGGQGNRRNNIPEVAPSFEFKCYGETMEAAWEVFRALHDFLFGKQNVWISVASAYLIDATEDTFGQSVIDPRTNWPFVLAFWTLKFRSG